MSKIPNPSKMSRLILKSFVKRNNLIHPKNCKMTALVMGGVQQLRFYTPEPIKRFYGDVGVKKLNESENEFTITLDQKNLKTPARRIFKTKNEALANAVAAEWEAQKGTIMQSTMHLTALANTVQDNPHFKSKFDLTEEILSNLPVETIIYRSPDNPRLWDEQSEKWDPILYWFQDEFGVKLPIVSGSIMPPEIPDETLTAVRTFIMHHSIEAVQGLLFSVGAIRSVLLPLAVARNKISAEEAVQLSRLEVDFQTKLWGKVDWSHDVEYHDSVTRVCAGMLFFDLHSKVPFVQNSQYNENEFYQPPKKQTG